MRLESQPVDGDWTEIFELDRSPQPKRHLPAIRLAQAHVGGRRIRAQLPIVEVPHQMTLAVELNLDGRFAADHQLVVGANAASEEAVSRTLSQLRPWSLMLVIAEPDDYIDDMLAALRA